MTKEKERRDREKKEKARRKREKRGRERKKRISVPRETQPDIKIGGERNLHQSGLLAGVQVSHGNVVS